MRFDRGNWRRPWLNCAVYCLATIVASLLMALSVRPQTPDEKSAAQSTPQNAQAPEPPQSPEQRKRASLFGSLSGTIDFGARFWDLNGDRPGKFQETRDIPKGLSLQNIHLHFNPADSQYFFDFKGQEIRERDQRYSAEAGKVGVYRAQFLWDQLPHYFSDGRTLFFRTAPGVLSVSQTLRASLEAVPDAGVAASQLGPQLPALMSQAMTTAHVIQLRVQWDQLLVTQSYRPNKNWEFIFRVQHLRLNGNRIKGTGTFAREANGPGGDGVWESMGAELPEPVAYGTTNLTFSAQYTQPKWRIGIDYNLSLFRNSIPSLTWDNPFRVTDAIAIGPAFGVGRNRFAQGQLALAPDNDYESVRVHGSVDLPRDTQIRGAVRWGRGTQNVPFLPYTLNSALTAANLPKDQPALFGVPLPKSSLDGVVNTLDQNYVIASRPWKQSRLLLQYRSNNRDNQTPQITFPGQQAFGDSQVRTSVDFYGVPVENFPTSYTRQNTTATWQWDPNKKFSWELDYDWEIWNRTFRDATRTNEHTVSGELNYKPQAGVNLKADYHYGDRTPRSYVTQPLIFDPVNGGSWVVTPTTKIIPGVPLEFNLLRRYDEDKRILNDGEVSLDVTRFEKLSFSGQYRYLRENYDKSFYGLIYGMTSNVDAQVSYIRSENTSFYASYGHEQDRSMYRALGRLQVGGTPGINACCAQYPLANTWERTSRINFDTVQIGINTSFNEERTVLEMSYGLGFGKDRTNTVNPFTVLANSTHTAGAVPYPNVLNRQQELNLSITHKLREGLDLGFSYRLEPYGLDDYYTNGLVPYSAKQSVDGNLLLNTPRQLFLDARFTSYHANVARVFLRYTF